MMNDENVTEEKNEIQILTTQTENILNGHSENPEIHQVFDLNIFFQYSLITKISLPSPGIEPASTYFQMIQAATGPVVLL